MIPWDTKYFDVDQLFRGQLKIQQRDGYENVKIFNRFNTQNNNFARTFLYISIMPFLHDDHVKMPNCPFYGIREQATTKFYFSFWTWIWSFRIQLQEGSPTFDKVG